MVPLDRTAQAEPPSVEIAVAVVIPLMATGIELENSGRGGATWKFVTLPQHWTVPPDRRAQVRSDPTDTSTAVEMPETPIGTLLSDPQH